MTRTKVQHNKAKGKVAKLSIKSTVYLEFYDVQAKVVILYNGMVDR